MTSAEEELHGEQKTDLKHDCLKMKYFETVIFLMIQS